MRTEARVTVGLDRAETGKQGGAGALNQGAIRQWDMAPSTGQRFQRVRAIGASGCVCSHVTQIWCRFHKSPPFTGMPGGCCRCAWTCL